MKGKDMTKLTKIMLAMIASLSLLSTSYAGEVTVTGNAEATYSISGAKTGTSVDDTDTVGGKGIGVANEIDFTATGETDNGYTWKYQTQFDDGSATDDGRLEITSPFGTVGFYVSEGSLGKHYGWDVSAYGAGSDQGITTDAEINGIEASDYNNIQYHTPAGLLPFGIQAKVAFAPNGATGQTKAASVRAQGANTADIAEATSYQITATPIDGLSVGASYAEATHNGGVTATKYQPENGSLYVKYAIGPATIGYGKTYIQPRVGARTADTDVTNEARKYENTSYGLGVSVNDQLSVSFTTEEFELTEVDIDAGTDAETSATPVINVDTIQAAYNVGGMTVAIGHAEADEIGYNGDNATANDEHDTTQTFISVKMAF